MRRSRPALLAMCMGSFLCTQSAFAGDPPSGDIVLVGMVSEQGIRQCQGVTKEPKWIHPHLEIGFVWAFPHKDFRFHKSRLVIAKGRTAPRPALRVKESLDCPGAQMRSDWVWSKNGMRVRRNGSPPFNAAFISKSVKSFDGLVIRDKGAPSSSEMEVAFVNTTGHPLNNLKLIVHYEGCYGKPGTTLREELVPKLGVGEKVIKIFPKVVERKSRAKWRRIHLASSLQITAKPHPVYFDLDWPLSRVKRLKRECPNRRSKYAK